MAWQFIIVLMTALKSSKKIAWDLLNAFKFCKEDLKSILIISKSRSVHPERDPKVGCRNVFEQYSTQEMLTLFQAMWRKWLQGIHPVHC